LLNSSYYVHLAWHNNFHQELSKVLQEKEGNFHFRKRKQFII